MPEPHKEHPTPLELFETLIEHAKEVTAHVKANPHPIAHELQEHGDNSTAYLYDAPRRLTHG